MLMVLVMVLAVQDIAPSPGGRSEPCSAFETGAITPGDKLELLDDFRANLSAGDRQRLDQALPRDAQGGVAQCDSAEGSRAACEAAAYMPALRRTGLMPRFLAFLSSKPNGAATSSARCDTGSAGQPRL